MTDQPTPDDTDVLWDWISEYHLRLVALTTALETLIRDTDDRKRSILAATLRHLAKNLPPADVLDGIFTEGTTTPKLFASRQRQLFAELADQLSPGSQPDLNGTFLSRPPPPHS